MPPGHQNVDQIPGDFSFEEKHFEDFMPEDPPASPEAKPMAGRSLPGVLCQNRRNSEHALPIRTAVCSKYRKMRIKPKKIAKRLYGDSGSRQCIFFWHRFLEKHLH